MLGHVYLCLSGEKRRAAKDTEQRVNGNSAQEKRKLTGRIRKKTKTKNKVDNPGHSASSDCVKNPRRGVKAQLTLQPPNVPVQRRRRLSDTKQGGTAANMWADTRD